jgi:hypothetical protein
VIKELLANTTKEHLENEDEEEEDQEEDEEQDDEYQASNEQKAFQVIQKKYEQNLNVVETLYHEKINLEEYTKLLEKEIELLTGKKIVNSPFSKKMETIRKKKSKKARAIEEQEASDDEEGEQEEDHMEGPNHRHSSSISTKQQPKQSTYEPSNIKFPSSSSPHSFSASELAALLEHLPDEKIPRNSRSKNLKSSSMDGQVKRSHSAPRWSTGSTTAMREGERDLSIPRKRKSQDDSLTAFPSSSHRSLISRSHLLNFHLLPELPQQLLVFQDIFKQILIVIYKNKNY